MEQVLYQYGAIGAICVYLMWRDYASTEKLTSVMTEIKEIMQKQLIQNEMHADTIDSERGRNKDCYEKVVSGLAEIKKNQSEHETKLNQILANQGNCSTCLARSHK